jgi:hypothetical protein
MRILSAIHWRGIKWPTALVLGIGSLQIIGFLTQIDAIRNIGRLTSASPLPFVFSDFRGLETYSLEFNITAEGTDGTSITKLITPKLYGEFKGPYNRRNVYGAVLAYGPKLREPSEKSMVDSVLKFGFCNNGPLAEMFESSTTLRKVVITATSKSRNAEGPFVTEVNCP